MCEFCKNIIDYFDFERKNPYLLEEKALPFGEERTYYKIIIPVEFKGVTNHSNSVDDIVYCPYCGGNVYEREN